MKTTVKFSAALVALALLMGLGATALLLAGLPAMAAEAAPAGASVGSDERLAELGRALGRQRIEKGSLCAIRAVIASRSGVTKTDREAWEAYGLQLLVACMS